MFDKLVQILLLNLATCRTDAGPQTQTWPVGAFLMSHETRNWKPKATLSSHPVCSRDDGIRAHFGRFTQRQQGLTRPKGVFTLACVVSMVDRLDRQLASRFHPSSPEDGLKRLAVHFSGSFPSLPSPLFGPKATRKIGQ